MINRPAPYFFYPSCVTELPEEMVMTLDLGADQPGVRIDQATARTVAALVNDLFEQTYVYGIVLYTEWERPHLLQELQAFSPLETVTCTTLSATRFDEAQQTYVPCEEQQFASRFKIHREQLAVFLAAVWPASRQYLTWLELGDQPLPNAVYYPTDVQQLAVTRERVDAGECLIQRDVDGCYAHFIFPPERSGHYLKEAAKHTLVKSL